MRPSLLALFAVVLLIEPAFAQKPPAPAKYNTVPLIRTQLFRKAETPELPADPQTTLDAVLKWQSTRYSIRFVLNEKAFQAEGVNKPADLAVVQNKALQVCPNLNSFLRQLMTRATNMGPVPSGARYVLRRDHIEITTGKFLATDRTPAFPLVEKAALTRGIQQTTASLNNKRAEYPEIAADPQTELKNILNALAKRYGVEFEINELAFEAEAVKVHDLALVGKKALPAAKNVTLAKYLELVLVRIPAESGAVAVARFDHIEITTKGQLLRERQGGGM